MKKLMSIVVVLMMGSILIGAEGQQSGCVNFAELSEDEIALRQVNAMVGITARNIGYSVAETEDPEVDAVMRDLYTLVKDGKLTDHAIETLTKRLSSRPTLVDDAIDLMDLLGARFGVGGSLVGVDKLPESTYKKIEASYLQGISRYKNRKK